MNEVELFDEEFDAEINSKEQLEEFYSHGFRNSGVAYLRFILMAFVCFWNYGFPEPTGLLSTISGFAIPCFFILSGYYILPNGNEHSTDKLKRKIKRTFLCFAFMFIVYSLLNLLGCGLEGILDTISRRTVSGFLLLNVWPFTIGSNIWFIQAMLYAYVVIFFIEKLHLMRFYKVLLIVSMLIVLLSGEFAGLIQIDILGSQYLPGNWLTRALPYILLGKFLREKEEILLRIAAWKYVVLCLIGVVLSVGEILLLGSMKLVVNEGCMIGYSIMALSVCCLALSKPVGTEKPLTAFLTQFDPVLSGIIYIFMGPLFYVLGVIIMYFLGTGYIRMISFFGGMAAYATSILFAVVFRNAKLFKAFYS